MTGQRRFAISPMSWRRKTIIRLLRATFCALILLVVPNSSDGVQAQSSSITLDKSPKMQQDRLDFINKLIKLGVFYKQEKPGSIPKVWVTPAFYELNIDLKQNFVSVVYAYYFDGSNPSDFVEVRDSKTGKWVATFSSAYGGLRWGDE